MEDDEWRIICLIGTGTYLYTIATRQRGIADSHAATFWQTNVTLSQGCVWGPDLRFLDVRSLCQPFSRLRHLTHRKYRPGLWAQCCQNIWSCSLLSCVTHQQLCREVLSQMNLSILTPFSGSGQASRSNAHTLDPVNLIYLMWRGDSWCSTKISVVVEDS